MPTTHHRRRSATAAPTAAVAALSLALAAALAPATADAHDVFWSAGAPADTLLEGHLTGHGHGGAANEPLAASRVAWLATIGADGVVHVVPVPAAAPVTVAADGVADFALVEWGWWTKTADGTTNSHPSEVAHPLQGWHSQETVKHLRGWHQALGSPLGRGLELTPLADPRVLSPGDKLAVLVTLDGAPVEGAAVAYGDDTRGASGSDGRVNIRLRKAGLQVVRASLRRPDADAPRYEDVRTAVLTFELEHR
jgi:nickel transport protein